VTPALHWRVRNISEEENTIEAVLCFADFAKVVYLKVVLASIAYQSDEVRVHRS